MRTQPIRVLVVVVCLLVACRSGTAREVISLDNEFGILRDFASITIAKSDIPEARAFIDLERFSVSTLPPAENAKLRSIAIENMGSKFKLVKSKSEANYLIQIRMEQHSDHAVRNYRNEHSRGYVMISLCRLPVGKLANDCENLQYDYFRIRNAEEVFSTVVAMWLKAKFPSP